MSKEARVKTVTTIRYQALTEYGTLLCECPTEAEAEAVAAVERSRNRHRKMEIAAEMLDQLPTSWEPKMSTDTGAAEEWGKTYGVGVIAAAFGLVESYTTYTVGEVIVDLRAEAAKRLGWARQAMDGAEQHLARLREES